MNLMFLDESKSEKVRQSSAYIASMTALIVPAKKYNSVQTAFYDILKPFIQPEENTINLSPPELHGRALLKDLPEADDTMRLQIWHKIVNLVIENQLDIYRVGYYITPEFLSLVKGDRNGISSCWFRITEVTQPVYQEEQLIVIMDGFNKDAVHKMSGMIRSCDIVRSVGSEDHLSLQNTENLIGEVFYADSQYSAMIQIVDNISYLRQVNDLSQEGHNFSEFKQKVLAEAKRLDPCPS